MKFLPTQPSLEFLSREARELKSQHRAKDNSVCKTIGHFDTSFHGLKNDEIFARKFSILDAQRVTARQYGFASWRRLKLFVQKSTNQANDYNTELRDVLLSRKIMLDALAKRAKKKKPDGRERYIEFIDESQSDDQRNIQEIWLAWAADCWSRRSRSLLLVRIIQLNKQQISA